MTALALGYYNAFAQAWNSTVAVADPTERASAAVNATAPAFINSAPIPDDGRLVMLAVLGSFNLTTFNNAAAHHAFALNLVSTASGINDTAFLEDVYEFGASPNEDDVRSFASDMVSVTPTSELPVEVPQQLLSNFVSEDRRTMLLLFNFDISATYVDDNGVYPLLENVKVIRAEIAALNGEMGSPDAVYVTGEAAISEDMRASSEADMKMIEPMTIIIIFVLMGILFRSIIAQFLPLGAVGVAVGISQALHRQPVPRGEDERNVPPGRGPRLGHLGRRVDRHQRRHGGHRVLRHDHILLPHGADHGPGPWSWHRGGPADLPHPGAIDAPAARQQDILA